MGIFHFLNVKQGDCSIIEHPNGHVTVIDVCNARAPVAATADSVAEAVAKALRGNYHQKDHPVNPIEYMQGRGLDTVFRFIATHPDMDHLDGIKDFFAAFTACNFWDTNNNKELNDWGRGNNGPYRQEDWLFYKSLRDGTSSTGIKRLALHAGDRGKYYNESDNGGGGDGLYVLSPTPALVTSANECGNHNDCSYVILYRSNAGRILFLGDAHEDTIDHVVATYRKDVEDVDLMIAPHHGRRSGLDFEFLDIVRPKLTLFGNASSEHLAYDPWYNRDLPIITNNQANCVIVDTNGSAMQVYVTNQTFALKENPGTFYSEEHGGWYLQTIGYVAQAAE